MDVWHPSSEGYLKIQGIRIFYRMFGESEKKGTIICLHGGPGCASDYMLPFTDLVRYGYKVVLYDQMGCGKSELPSKTSMTVERHVEELEGVRNALNLGKIHLVGNSWGGMLAIEYVLKYQSNVITITDSSGPSSIPILIDEIDKMNAKLPPEVQEVLKKYQALGEFNNPEYIKAAMVWYKRHFCRLSEYPPEVQYAVEQSQGPVYQTMFGPNEFLCIGVLRYWDRRDQLSKIKVPCLFTVGDFDEVAPSIMRSMHEAVKGSEFFILENSGHLTMWDNRDTNIEVVRNFLDKNA
jgi:proline iminopeptidase